MYFVRTPHIIKKLYPKITWEMPADSDSVFLTFDDGPHPEITPWILGQLEKFQAKATFFCLGQHAEKYPEIIMQIKAGGHTIGHHSYSHLNGWKTNNDLYFQDVEKGQEILNSGIFRPPYGKLKRSQYSILSTQYSIYNWSLMPGDFDLSISNEKCFQNFCREVKAGDIVCLHDNEKAFARLRYCLPRWLEFLTEKKLFCKAL